MAGLRRMTESDWRTVRELYSGGLAAKTIAARFPVAASTIHKRACVERWRDLGTVATRESDMREGS